MAKILPIGWLGARRRAMVRTSLERRLEAWDAGWTGVPGSTCLLDAGPMPVSLEWHIAATHAGTLAIGGAGSAIERLGARLAGCETGRDGGLAARLGERALEDLAATLLGQTSAPLEHAGRTDVDARRGGALFELRIGNVAFRLHVDKALGAVLAPAADDVSRRPLASRRDAVAPCTTAVSAQLALGRVPLADVSTLRPGDVLHTRLRVGGLVQLATADGRVIGTGQLAADGEHRAVRIQ